MEILNYLKAVELIGNMRFKLTFIDDSTMVIARDKYYWYAMDRTNGYAREASLVEIQHIDFYNLRTTYAKEA